jgi:signal transduction histidine kinase
MSLRLRLTLFFSIFIAVILTVVAVSVYTLTKRSLSVSMSVRADEALDRLDGGRMPTALRLLPGDIYSDVIILGGANVPIRTVGDLRRFEGEVPWTSYPLRQLFSDANLQTLLDTGEVTTSSRLDSGVSILLRARLGRIVDESRELSYRALLAVGVPANAMTATLNQLGSVLLLTVVGAFMLFGLGVWLLSRQVLAPLQRITHTASRVTSLDLSQRVPVPRSRDEMHEMAVTINRMLDRLLESFETQRRFTADASHELRTPVTAIVGHTNYLLRRTRPNPEQVDSLTVIRREAERMTKLVNDLLELARADAGFSIEREAMNLVEVAEAVHMEVAPVAGHAEIEITSPQPSMMVMGDAARLKQVILNLLLNALNAGANHISISFQQEKNRVRMELFDNGPGIPAEALPHLFERFYRVDGARSTRGAGSGLGLAIVNWIVQQHDGSLEVTSQVGEGTVFTVLLPAADPRRTEVGTARELRQTRAG